MHSVLLLTLFDETIIRILSLKDSEGAVPLSILVVEILDVDTRYEYEPVVCPGGQKGQQHSGLDQEHCGQQD